MSAVFNVREGMGLARKSGLVGPTKCWPDIFFFWLHCRGTYKHFAVMIYTAPNTYTDSDQRGLDYHSHKHIFHIFLPFKVGIKAELYFHHSFNFCFLYWTGTGRPYKGLTYFCPIQYFWCNLWYISVILWLILSVSLHISFVMQPLFAYLTRLVPFLSVPYPWGYQRKARGCWKKAGTVRTSLHCVRPQQWFLSFL